MTEQQKDTLSILAWVLIIALAFPFILALGLRWWFFVFDLILGK